MGLRPRFGDGRGLGPIGYTPTEALVAGQLVAAVAGEDRQVEIAGAASAVVVGVALEAVVATRVTATQIQVDDEHGLPVAYGCVVAVTFNEAAEPGAALAADAAGEVQLAGADPVVGWCFGSPVDAGDVGLAYIGRG
jgi:hypothetical protein